MSIHEYEGGEGADDDYKKQNEDKMDAAKIKQLVKENMYSGITVALVSLPLSSALAMAQGATAMMGLTTAIFGPGIQGIIGGSHYNILGPAGALVNIVSALSGKHGMAIIPWTAAVAGAMSFIVYLLKFENYCTMLPTSVLEGFSLGVATTIGLGQLGFAFGLDGLKQHPEFYMRVVESVTNLDKTQSKEFLCFLPFFVVLMSLLKWKPAVPWIIVIAAIGIVYGIIMRELVEPDIFYDASGKLLPNPKPQLTPLLLKDVYPTLSSEVNLADFSYWNPKKALGASVVIIGAFKIAFVAVLETLISARIADNKTNTRFNQSQEIFGMAICNMVCGLLGGTPCTGVLIRTNVNIQTKATHKTSQFINAVFVFFTVILFMNIFTYIPMAVIASILVTSSCRLVPKTIMRQLWNVDKFEFWILIITWLICVFKDGAVGLMIGAFLSFLKQSEKQSETQMKITDETNVLNVELNGSLDYINGLHFEVQVNDHINIKESKLVCVDLSKVLFVDIDGLFVLDMLYKKKGVEVNMVYDRDDENSVLCKSALFQDLKAKGKVYKSQNEAHAALLQEKEA